MKEPQEGDLGVWGSIDFANEAVQLEGETGGYLTIHHESLLSQKIHSIVSQVGGKVTGDEAIYI